MADINEYAPKSGNIIGADNEAHNVVDLLGGGTPIDNRIFDINQFAPSGGLVIGSDGRLYDITKLLPDAATNATEAEKSAIDAKKAKEDAEKAASSVGNVVIQAKEAIADAQNATQKALEAVGDMGREALRTSASKWEFYVRGNPANAYPATGSLMEVTSDKAAYLMQSSGTIFDGIFEQGSISTTGKLEDSTIFIRTKNYITVLPGLTLTKSNSLGAPYGRTAFYKNGTFVSVLVDVNTFTVPAGANQMKYSIYRSTGITVNDVAWGKLENGAIATPYTPPYPPYAGVNVYSMEANVPIEITAIQGENHLYADNSAWLLVCFNRDSMDFLNTDLTVPVSATGSIAEIDGCIGGLPLDVTVRAVATGGGGTPDAPIPIVPAPNLVGMWHGGKNLIGYSENSSTQNGVTIIYNADGSITLSGTATARVYTKIVSQIQKRKLPPGTYTLSVGATLPVGCSVLVGHYNTSGNYTGNLINLSVGQLSKTATLAKETDFLDGYFDVSAGTTVNITIFPQLELGSTATPYEPYVGHTYPVPVSEPLYGDTAYPAIINSPSGILTIQKTLIELQKQRWSATTYSNATYIVFQVEMEGTAKLIMQTSRCSHFPNVSNIWGVLNREAFSDHETNQRKYFCVAHSRIGSVHGEPAADSLAKFMVWLESQGAAGTPVQLEYVTIVPRTITFPVLIPAQHGYNAVYSDAGGDTTVTGQMGLQGYKAQTEARMDIMQAQLTALQAKIMIP